MLSHPYRLALAIIAFVLAACAPSDKPIEEVTIKEVPLESVLLGGTPVAAAGNLVLSKPTTCSFRLSYKGRPLSYYIDNETAIGRNQQFEKCLTLRTGDLVTVVETAILNKESKPINYRYRWWAGKVSDNLI